MDPTSEVMKLYPKIFFACHTRHVRDGDRTITAHQVSILHHLDREEPTAVLTLAKHMGVRPATISTAVDRLEGMGYVVRERGAQDKRVVNLFLTEAGDKIRSAEEVLDRDIVKQLLGQLSDKEKTEALQGLRHLAKAAESVMAAKSKGGSGRWRS